MRLSNIGIDSEIYEKDTENRIKLRRNAEDFDTGDVIVMHELVGEVPSGRKCIATIIAITYPCERCGLGESGYVVLSIGKTREMRGNYYCMTYCPETDYLNEDFSCSHCICDTIEDFYERNDTGCPCGNNPKWERAELSLEV